MCGIAGLLLRNEQARLETLRAMCDRIRHRGPDDEGYHLDGGCGLGMRRLSIIDLSSGHQPISNEDGSVWVVFNGEIYNYRELGAELLQRGHRFSTASDTETLVHLYEQEGVAGLSRLRGMFAFAIWDTRLRRLLLARDRFGKKPLYYAALPQGFYFGSELKCLRAAGVPLEVDEEALRWYFQFSFVPDPYSPLRHVRKLPPGCWLLCEEDGAIRQDAYWKPPIPAAQGSASVSPGEARLQIRQRFDEAVRVRMIADVPLGAFLSGGIDSSLVVASMARQSPEPVKTFSIGFEESEYNELEFAAAVARRYKTDHRQMLVRPDSVALVSRLVHHFDEPFGDYSAIPTFVLAEFAAGHVKVALSGDGGDELFFGYPRYIDVRRDGALEHLPRLARHGLGGLARLLPYSFYGKQYLHTLSLKSAFERYLERNYCPSPLRRRLFQSRWAPPADGALFASAFDRFLLPADYDLLSRVVFFDTCFNLPGDMLVKVDRMSMAHSLEVRCPLLDHSLAELAATLPHESKIRGGKGKRILIEALGDRLPAEVLSHPKTGFGVPLRHWFRGSLREFLWDHLTGPRFLERGIVRPDFLRHLLEEHQSGRRNHSYWLWSLLMLEVWFRDLELEAGPPAR
jgi:asparagine synthase (glutamine-hydrolysing)